MQNHFNPSADERREIIAAAAAIFKQRFYSPTLEGLGLDSALAECMPELLARDAFPAELTAVFARSGAKPIEVFHESERKVALARFLKATFFETSEREYVFRDVLLGGRARQHGISTGDRLVTVNGTAPTSEDVRVHAHTAVEVVVEGKDGTARTFSYPAPSSQKPRPEQNVEFFKLSDEIGHIRIASWPGILGIEVARETDAAIRALRCKRLIVDLRGNFGSVGAGNLRIMSYLSPGMIPVGYSLTRRRAEGGYNRESLTRFERIPRWKIEGLPILWKFRKLDKSIVVVTEGLRHQAFHGNVVVLVNRYTVSGAEIVVQFAKEHRLAVIVGEQTAGRSLSFGTFQLPQGFRFTFPIGDYIPWSGARFEDCGVEPDVFAQFTTSAGVGVDRELSTAMQVLQSKASLREAAKA
jgi:C-terminal processing protease CtpA/Prc